MVIQDPTFEMDSTGYSSSSGGYDINMWSNNLHLSNFFAIHTFLILYLDKSLNLQLWMGHSHQIWKVVTLGEDSL